VRWFRVPGKEDSPEGTEVSVTILETPEERDLDIFRRRKYVKAYLC
jgi:hypothetical protein